jgi:FkbM family methyltransferase
MTNFLQRITRFALQKARFSTGNSSPLGGYVDHSQLALPQNLIRLGTPYGGWIIPRKPVLTESSICYLAGAGEDISFDCALAKRFSCSIRIVDPTPRAVRHFKDLERAVKEGRRCPVNNSDADFYEISEPEFARFVFLPFGLADMDVEMKFYMPKNPMHVSCSTVNLQKTKEYFNAQCYRLATLMKQQGDTRIDLLKMDIEGGEHAVVRDMLASNLLPRILLIEFDEAHTPLDEYSGARIEESIKQLVGAGMRCIAVEGSNATFIRTW